MVARRLLPALIIAMFLAQAATCEEIDMSAFEISQAVPAYPSIRVYLNLFDKTGDPPQTVDTGQLHVTVGRHDAIVSSIQPFKDSGEGTGFILLADVSKSLNEAQFSEIREALAEWTDAMTEKDRTAILTFGTSVQIIQDFTGDQPLLKTKIAALEPTDNNTQLHRALTDALEMGRRRDPGLPGRRAIVVLSDGMDDCEGGKTRQEVMDAIREHRVPIYAIGLCGTPCGQIRRDYLKNLGAFARASGGVYFRAGAEPFTEIYAKMRSLIRGVTIATVDCSACEWDGNMYRLQMTLTTDTRSVSAGADVRLLPPARIQEPENETESSEQPPAPPQTAPKPEPSVPIRLYAACGVLVLLVLLLLIRIRTRKSSKIETPETDTPSPDASETAEPGIQAGAAPSTAESGIQIRLVEIGAGSNIGPFEFRLTNKVVLGRNPSAADLVIPGDDEISGKHCEFIVERGMVFIQDLGSRNGTMVNGTPIVEKQRVEDGDRILLGRSEFRVSL